MKRTVIVMLLSLVMGAAFLSPALAGRWGRGPEGGWGPGNCGGPCACRDADDQDSQARQDFRRQTQELRQQLRDRKDAYHALMRQDAPNKEEAAKLWGEIFDLQTKIHQMAKAAGVAPEEEAGRGEGYGPGAGCGKGPRCDSGPRCDNGPEAGCGRGCGGPRGRW